MTAIRPRRGRRAALFGAATVLLAACVGVQPPVPEDRFYRLPDTDGSEHLQEPLLDGTVAVARPTAGGLHHERAVLYIDSERPLEIRRHNYYFWGDSPPRLIQAHLLSYLRAVGVGERVMPFDPAVRADHVISGRLLRFERLLGPQGPAVVVSLELQLGAGGKSARGPADTYTITRPVTDDSVSAAAQGFGAALEEIYGRFVAKLPGR
ncbi:MAG: ABC transporter [Gammaproteobacteria bacterium]|nr:ABC transporter [Gammaproteobacteria bacterium]NIR98398.1 ABC transporter [Gammaproteobacteria bacterium]NIT64152.1 ABC transporter [Gammaproteobacteria bacterium]NIY32732.1 ABC transporter [Gammaproteobacteria bacterium]